MFKYCFFLLIVAATACSSPDQLTGKYVVEDYSFFYKAWKNLGEPTSFLLGSELELKPDSSYIYSSCSNRSTGLWRVEDDTLYLRELTIRWISDSLHEHGFNGRWPQPQEAEYKYSIEQGGKLKEEKQITLKSGREIRSVEVLRPRF